MKGQDIIFSLPNGFDKFVGNQTFVRVYSGVLQAGTGVLNSRRGRIMGMEGRSGAQVVTAMVPLAQMFGYSTDLRSATQGRATYSMTFDHYEQVPKSVAEEIVAKVKG